MARNPFQQLYVGEKVSPNEFVRIFSPVLIPHAMPLFQPGHVVLSGIQGSGKSMLFKLLQPEVRAAYEGAGLEFPLPPEARKFIGCGINVNTARCNEFGNRRIDASSSTSELMFGDFFSCIVALDLLNSVSTASATPGYAKSINLRFDEAHQLALVRRIRVEDVWSGYLKDVESWEQLVARLRHRISAYRRFLNFNDKSLDPEIEATKTPAGDPVQVIAMQLRGVGILPSDIDVFVHVDQYEELATIRPGGEATDYRSVVNRMLNSRASQVSYRVGTRGYAWRSHLNVFGTDARLEQDRDFKLVELDQKLRRQEDASTSLFPDFANDVFARRLRESPEPTIAARGARRVADLFGRSPSPTSEAKMLAGNRPEAIIRPESGWPTKLVAQLKELAQTDPLSAKLGEIWIRQKGHASALEMDKLPWKERNKQYWVKERTEMALLQIGGIRKQRAIFSGEEDIIGLSSGNILMFLSLCQLIWDYAAQATDSKSSLPEFPVNERTQSIAIYQAAREWVDRIPSDYGRSADRFRLVQMLGERFANLLHKDLKLSNPGQNGISFTVDDFRSRPDVGAFLIEAVDYGNLLMSEHATRNADRRRRIKFYLNPLYCPVYRIPFQRSKEPLYLTMREFEQWLFDAGLIESVAQPGTRRVKPILADAPLFDLLGHLDDD